MADITFAHDGSLNIRKVENGYIVTAGGGDEWVYTSLKGAMKAVEAALREKD